tara:strand:- start:84 stop:380 length:297 start_codon:yes stop_codon:yes gene_type:complete
MTQEVRVYDKWGNLKEVISDKRAKEISEANFMNIGFPTHNFPDAIEKKCLICDSIFMTKKKRQVNCNSVECMKKKRELLKKAKQEKRAEEKKLRIMNL